MHGWEITTDRRYITHTKEVTGAGYQWRLSVYTSTDPGWTVSVVVIEEAGFEPCDRPSDTAYGLRTVQEAKAVAEQLLTGCVQATQEEVAEVLAEYEEDW